MILTIEL